MLSFLQFPLRTIRYCRVGSTLILMGLAALCPLQLESQKPTLHKLTLAQVEELVSHGVPDSIMAAQVQRRGVAFAVTPATR
jgi:hypothetical protein